MKYTVRLDIYSCTIIALELRNYKTEQAKNIIWNIIVALVYWLHKYGKLYSKAYSTWAASLVFMIWSALTKFIQLSFRLDGL